MNTSTALIVSATLAASLVSPTLAGAAYTITDLGPGTAEAINDLGVIVGTGGGGGGAYIWRDGTYSSLMPQQGATLPFAGDLFSFTPKDINNNNVVAGYMYTQDGDRAFTWANGVFSALSSMPYQNYELKYSRAVGINNSNQVIGSVKMPGDSGGSWRATIWQSGAISSDIQWQTLAGDYPSAQWANTGGIAVNDLGHVVGTSESNDGWRPFLYKDGQMTELLSGNGFDMTGVNAKDINNLGTIVGEGLGNNGFILSNGTVKLLGFEGGTTSKALSVNDSNFVVGIASVPDEFQSGHAFLFDGKDMIDLSSLPEVIGSGWAELTYANDINNVGQIIGNGYINGEQHAFLLTPVSVPEPETYTMMLAGLGLVGAVARWRRS